MAKRKRRRFGYSGITEAPGREQPFTVWVDGEVIRFCTSRGEAELVLRHDELRREGGRTLWVHSLAC